jgi:hypothetical protein
MAFQQGQMSEPNMTNVFRHRLNLRFKFKMRFAKITVGLFWIKQLVPANCDTDLYPHVDRISVIRNCTHNYVSIYKIVLQRFTKITVGLFWINHQLVPTNCDTELYPLVHRPYRWYKKCYPQLCKYLQNCTTNLMDLFDRLVLSYFRAQISRVCKLAECNYIFMDSISKWWRHLMVHGSLSSYTYAAEFCGNFVFGLRTK